MVEYLDPCMTLDRSHHFSPYGFCESADHGVMVRHVLDRSVIMVAEDEHGGPQVIEESDPALDIVEVIVRGIGLCWIHERTGPQRCEIVGIPEVDDLIRREAFPEEQHCGQGIGVGAVAVGASHRHDPFTPSNNEHVRFQAQTFSFCKRL